MLKQTKKSVSFSDYVEYKEYNLTWQERYEKYHHYSKTIIKSLKNSKKKYKIIVKGFEKDDYFSDNVEYKENNLTWQERYEKYHHHSKRIIKSLKNSKKKYKKKRNKKRRNLLDNEQLNIKKIKF